MDDLLLSGEELTVKRFHPTNLPIKGEKEFKPKNDWLEKRQVVTQLDERFNFITSQRIEKVNAISQAQWIPNLQKAKVTKKVGNMWQTFGHHQDQEDWLLPEEVLYLVENGELELLLGEVRVSVERCTVLVLECGQVSWDQYRVFSFLIRSGMTVVRHSPTLGLSNHQTESPVETLPTGQKKPPFPGCSGETVIDEDISIIEDAVSLARAEKGNEEVIIIDDDLEDSDDICIQVKEDQESHCSEVSTERRSREWYPPASKFLLNDQDDVIDLCNEEDKMEISSYTNAITTKKDFLLISKQNILNIMPSAQNGISYIKAPDSRLLPRNVFPKYSEYKVNLNVRNSGGDRRRQPWFNRHYRPAPRRTYQVSRSVVNSFNRSPSPSMSPLLAKAQEMQAMAMSMIQTAASLMTAFQTDNPNELWNLMDPRNSTNKNSYRTRGGANRIAHRFKHRGRKYFNNSRAHVPYRPPLRWHSNMLQSWAEPGIPHSLLSPNDNVVEIIDSDDENSIGSSNISRKRTGDSGLVSPSQKRLKTEDIPDMKNEIDIIEIFDEVSSLSPIRSVLNEDSSNKLDVKIESKIKNVSVDEIKEETIEGTTSVLSSSAEPIKGEKTINENAELSKKASHGLENQNKEHGRNRIAAATLEKMEEVLSDNLIISSRESSKSPIIQSSNIESKKEEIRDSPDVVIITSEKKDWKKATCDEERTDWDRSDTSCIDMDSDEGSVGGEESDSMSEGPSTWEEYKEQPTQGSGEPTFHFPPFHSTNYGSILSALQIFKDIEVQCTKNKFKISYDVYLPTTKFKKSMKILPDYRAIIVKAEDPLPSPSEIENLKNENSDNVPFLFSIVTEASINFFLYDSVYLPSYD